MAINNEMRALILDNFGFRPTTEQENAAKMMADFVLEKESNSIFILRGYAGTGKTTLVGALVRSLDLLMQRTVLMASTGRAAKVFAQHTGHTAYTIHKRIYRQKTFTGNMEGFMQGVNLMKHTLFIVDEASMISNDGSLGSTFGTGRLLDDLIQFVYSGEGCRLMLIGDTAQLPPVGEVESPALDADNIAAYGLRVSQTTLTQVVRQVSESGILWNATNLRRALAEDDIYAFPRLRLTADVVYVSGSELIEELEQAYNECGTDDTIVVTRSNARAKAFNLGIRGRILGYEEELSGGDRLVIVKNNYHWLKPDAEQLAKTYERERQKTQEMKEQGQRPDTPEDDADIGPAMEFIANGDTAVIHRFRNEREAHGFRFVDATIAFPDFDDVEIEATILLDTLTSEAPALTRSQQEELFQRVWDDYPELTNKKDRMKAIKDDPYFNALQVKYAYAVTCHKAQGGQWRRVFVDQGFVSEDMLGPDYYRWLYTALTRATEKTYLINWPKQGLETDYED